ncbi:MAG: AcrB/AcrD/AcrF family protein, partial [Bacteroidetes bacterium]
MKLPKFSLDNYQFVLIVFILLTIAGINSYISIPRSENPMMDIPGASVITIYPGANPNDLEQLVAKPIEDAINELDDIIKVKTTIRDGITVTSVEFSFKTDPDKKFNEVSEKINSIKNKLPSDIYSIDLWKYSSTDVAILQLGLVSDIANYKTLKAKADILKNKLKTIKGIAKVKIIANPDQEIHIDIDFNKIAMLGVSLEQISKAIISNNTNIPGGNISLSDYNFGIKTDGTYNDLQQIKNTVINSSKGKILRLKDVANVHFDYQKQNWYAKVNKQKAIFIKVEQKKGYNIFDIIDKSKKTIADFNNNLPKTIKLKYVFDQSIGIDNRISNFRNNLLQGIFLVGLIIFLAIGFRQAVVVVTAIPLSIIIGLNFVYFMNIGLQQITIAALIIALGLLVDNSIVIVENISRYQKLGYSVKESAIKGTSEIGWPIVSSTVTTLLAFIPIAMMPDKAGEFIKGLPVTIVATLTVSMFIALSLNPVLAYFFNKKTIKSKPQNQSKTKFKYLNNFITGHYRRTLKYALNHKIIIILSSISLFVFSLLFAIFFVGKSFFPHAESPQFLIDIKTPDGNNLQKTEKVTSYIENVLDSVPDVKLYATNIGHGNPRVYYNIIPKTYSKNFAEVYVELNHFDKNDFYLLIDKLRKKFKNYSAANIEVKIFEQGVPLDAPIEVYFFGQDYSILKHYTDSLQNWLKANKNVININNELNKAQKNLFIKINKDKANIYGVPIYEINRTIRIATNGYAISKFHDKIGDKYDIVIKQKINKQYSINDFEKIYVKSLSGKMIPLRFLANIEFRKAPATITRYGFKRTAKLTADIKPNANIDEIMKPIIKKLKKLKFPQGYSYKIAGELEARSET